MDLSLQAIDFLFASSIQDGCPLSDMDCRGDGTVGDSERAGDDTTFFLDHLSSRGRSGIVVGLDSVIKEHNMLLNMLSLGPKHFTDK